MKLQIKSIKGCLPSFFLLLSLPFSELHALEFSPWHPTDFELIPTLSYSYSSSKTIAHKNHSVPLSLSNNFVRLNGATTIFSWFAEGELGFVEGSNRYLGVDHISLNVQYKLKEDTNGEEPYSLIAGGILQIASKGGLRDRGSFHHGQIEALFYTSIGKERSVDQFWKERTWSSLLLGISEIASPWIKGTIAWEHNSSDLDMWSVEMHGLIGFGKKTLCAHRKFYGYGEIGHRSLDLIFRYSHLLSSGAIVALQYEHMLYSYNFPKNRNVLSLSFSYPFGL